MTTTWQVVHLHSLLNGRSKNNWRWELVKEGGERYWALVQDDETGEVQGCDVYATGTQLSFAARVFAMVTPEVLLDVSRRALMVQGALERLAFLEVLAQRLLNRAYKKKRVEEYADLRLAVSEIVVLRQLLKASVPLPLAEVEAMERDALAAVSRPPPAD